MEAPPEKSAEKPTKKASSGEYLFLGKHRTIFAICLILAAAVHVLVLLVFGTYTLFKGSTPRMPFTSEGGVPGSNLGKVCSRFRWVRDAKRSLLRGRNPCFHAE